MSSFDVILKMSVPMLRDSGSREMYLSSFLFVKVAMPSKDIFKPDKFFRILYTSSRRISSLRSIVLLAASAFWSFVPTHSIFPNIFNLIISRFIFLITSFNLASLAPFSKLETMVYHDSTRTIEFRTKPVLLGEKSGAYNNRAAGGPTIQTVPASTARRSRALPCAHGSSTDRTVTKIQTAGSEVQLPVHATKNLRALRPKENKFRLL